MRRSCVLRVCVLAFLVLPLGVAPTASAATTRTVCAAGCDHPTIQAAIDASVDGDVISVAAGTHADPFDVDVAVTITGAKAGIDARTRATDDGETIITGLVGVGAPLVLDGVSLSPATGQALTANDTFTLRNTRVRGTGVASPRGGVVDVDVVGVGAVTVTIDRSSIALVGSGSAVLLDNVTAATITSSSFGAPATGTTYAVEAIGAGGTLAMTGNAFTSFDRALYARGAFGSTTVFQLNRIVRQNTSSDGVYSVATTAVDATDNLWGCGAVTPATSGTCDVVGGTGAITVTPFLVVTPSAAANPVPHGVATAVTASITRQDGSAAPAGSLAPTEGAVVTFAVTSSLTSTIQQGALSATTATLASGVASVNYTPPADGGPFVLKAIVDGARYSREIVTRGVPASATSSAKVTGTRRFPSPLTCAATWSRTGTVTYAWLRNGVAITGATAATYVPMATDIGTQFRCSQTVQPANTDPTTSTSPAVKLLKRRAVLAILQSNVRGAALACGTARRPCSHRRTGTLYLKVQRHATHFRGMKVQVVLERKVGRRWIAQRPIVRSVGAWPLAVTTKLLPVGAYRVGARVPLSRTDEAVNSAYRYLKLKA